MKITKKQLRKIIREELIREAGPAPEDAADAVASHQRSKRRNASSRHSASAHSRANVPGRDPRADDFQRSHASSPSADDLDFDWAQDDPDRMVYVDEIGMEMPYWQAEDEGWV